LDKAKARGRTTERGTPDPVQYLIVAVPDLDAVAGLLDAVARLVESKTLRILDCAVLVKDDLGALNVLSVDDIDGVDAKRLIKPELRGLLTDHDLELTAFSLAPGTASIVVVTEDRWAEPLTTAAEKAGGRIAAGEFIAPQRVGAALDEPDRDLLARPPVGHNDVQTGWADMILDPIEQLKTLVELRDAGALSDEEFARQKAKIVGGSRPND
jgi:hypothetical protein